MTSVQNPIDNLSFGVLHDSRACLSNAAGQGVHLNDESRDDDSNAFPVLSSVSVKREAGAPAAEQFDLSNPVDVNIRDGHRLHYVGRQFQCEHDFPSFLTGKSYKKIFCGYKTISLAFIAGGVQSNQIQIRAASASPKHRDSAGLELSPQLASRVYSLCVGFLPNDVRRQLASAISGVRIFLSGLIGRDKYPPRTPTDRLEAFGSVVRLPLHVNQHGREVIHNHGQVVRRKHRA